MAIVVTSALMISIAPVVALSVAARVQARRVDLATQAARSYIDGLRSNAIDPPDNNSATFYAAGNIGNLGVPAPRSLVKLQCLDKNLNSLRTCASPNKFMVIQSFRDGPPDPEDAKTQGYCVGVRVYRADAFRNGSYPTGIQPLKNMFTETASTKNAPIVVMRTQITNQTTFEGYKKFYVNNPNESNPDPKPIPNPCG